MPKDVKNLVDEVVDRLAKHPKVAELYELWYQQKCAIIATYTNNYPPKEPLSENETFRPIKNAVLEAAKEMGEMTEMVGGHGRLAGPAKLGTGFKMKRTWIRTVDRRWRRQLRGLRGNIMGAGGIESGAYEGSEGCSP